MKIGLTGGIGSGKTTISKYLIDKGHNVIDADVIARDVVSPGSKALEDIKREFGSGFFLEDGSLDRKALGELVFNNPSEKKKLEEITHKEIIKEIKRQLNLFGEKEKKIVFLDAPLLFEVGLDKYVDLVWLVTASQKNRGKRVSVRDNISIDDVEARIRNQMAEEEKIERADVKIDNNGTKEELYQEIDKLLGKYE